MSTRLEGLHQRIGTGFGHARADDHGNGTLAHDLAQKGKPIHARHFDVEEHHVRHFLANAFDGDIGIGCRGHDLQRGIAGDDLAQRHAYRGAIVDDQDTDLAVAIRHG